MPVLALGTCTSWPAGAGVVSVALAVAALCAFAAGVVSVAPFTAPLPRDELARGSEVFGLLPRVLAAASSGVATVIVAVAVWSASRVRTARLMVANALIAVGTLVTGASGLLNSVLDEMTGFAVAPGGRDRGHLRRLPGGHHGPGPAGARLRLSRRRRETAPGRRRG